MLSGVKALYKGLGPCLLRTFPSSGALLLAVEVTKDVMYNAYDKVVWGYIRGIFSVFWNYNILSQSI